MINASGPTDGKVIKPSDGEKPKRGGLHTLCRFKGRADRKTILFRVCCMYIMKNAQLIKDKMPDTEVTLYYMDIRAFGKGFEEFLQTFTGEIRNQIHQGTTCRDH